MIRHPLGNPASAARADKARQVPLSMPRRLIALILAVASVVLLVAAVMKGWRLANEGGAWDDWAPAVIMFVAGVILFLGARAALNPEVTPELPETTSPDHIEH